jgi:serine/threonine protein kinase
MSNFPDFSHHGYTITQELGRNREGGRISWLAQDAQQQPVMIKQFCFAQAGSDWSGHNAHLQEITILRSLNHPGILRYLNSIETTDGFLLIQEYKQSLTLSQAPSYGPDQAKAIMGEILGSAFV